MSYAAAAEKNSQGGGAKPSQEFLEGSLPRATDGHGHADEVKSSVDVNSGKVNVIPADSDLEHLKTETSEAADRAKALAEEEAKRVRKSAQDAKKYAVKEADKLSKNAAKYEKSLAEKAREVGAQVQQGWAHLSSDPKAWGTLLGAVNVALLGGLGYFAYTERNNYKNWDRRIVSAVTVGVLGLLGGQGYVAAETARKQTGKK